VTPVKAKDFLSAKIRPDWPWISPNLLQWGIWALTRGKAAWAWC